MLPSSTPALRSSSTITSIAVWRKSVLLVWKVRAGRIVERYGHLRRRPDELVQRFVGNGIGKSLAYCPLNVGNRRHRRLGNDSASPLRHIDGELLVAVGNVLCPGILHLVNSKTEVGCGIISERAERGVAWLSKLNVVLLRVQEPLNLSTPRHGVLRATLRDDQRSGGGCKTERTFKRLSLCKRDGERPREPVSRRHGIDRVYLKGGHMASTLNRLSKQRLAPPV